MVDPRLAQSDLASATEVHDTTLLGGAEEELVPELQPAESPKQPPQALILEDDLAQLQLLTYHLDSFGLRSETATTVGEAREKLLSSQFQLGLFDYKLPDGDSLELCQTIDDDPRLVGLPIIVLTSAPEDQIVRKIRAAGACFFLGKPYDPNVLMMLIERALEDCP